MLHGRAVRKYYCFLKFSVLHGRNFGGTTQIFWLPPQKLKLVRHYFFFVVESHSKKTLVQKIIVRTYKKCRLRGHF